MMMSLFPVGLIVAIISFLISIQHLKQELINYYDFVAFFMVFGGTAAVTLILLPWDHRKDLLEALKGLYIPQTLNYRMVLSDCLDSIKSHSVVINAKYPNSLYAQTLRDGFEMIDLGLEKEKIEQILFDRVSYYGKRKRKVSSSIRSLAKYPPAFGLMGTVLGLVNVMRGVSTGQDSKTTALEMAIALIATMYGLVVANLLINPAGELILKKSNEEEQLGQIAIHAVSMVCEKRSLLEAQEVLNSYVPADQRLSVLDEYSEDAAA
jgi:chemotaxis protein MotA